MEAVDKRMLEREALRNMIQQWNANRLDLFELSEPNENLEFHGVMRFYFQDSGQKIATKCIRVASDATVSDVIETLIEKFRPDMRMLSLGSYSLWETHGPRDERRLEPHEKPLLVQLNWHADDREGRFLLKCTDNEVPINSSEKSDQNFKRKLSKREKKELKKKEKLSRLKSDANDENKPVAEKLYTELPETSFTRSISNPEAVMRRRRQQKLERRLQQFRSKDGGPDTGGTLKIYGGSLCPEVPYKTLLLSVGDCAAAVVREMLDKYAMLRHDPALYCIVQVNTADNSEYILEDDECPLAIIMTHPQRSSIMFHVRRRPADSQPRRRKKKAGSVSNPGSRAGSEPLLVEVAPDGSPLENARRIRLNDVLEVGSGNGMGLQLYGPSIQARHCVLASADGGGGGYCVTPLHADALLTLNGQRVYHTARLQHGAIVKFGRVSTFRFVDPAQETIINRNLSQSQHFGSGSIYDRSPTSPAPDNTSGAMSPSTGSHTQSGMDNHADSQDYQRTMSPVSQHTLNQEFGYKDGEPYNNNTLKMENDSLMMSHLNESKEDLIRDEFANYPEQDSVSASRKAGSQYKDNYETTFDLDGNVETKSICSAKSGGSGHDSRVSGVSGARPGQEAILPAVLEFPEPGQAHFLAAVITRLDPHSCAFKLAPVYTLYLCARYRASTHYRPELTPTERAHKLTAFLHHVATLVHATVQEKFADSAAQAFWMANASELLHFLKCDRHISSFSTQAQDLLPATVQAAFSNLVSCLQEEVGGACAGLVGAEGEAGGAGGAGEAAAPCVRALAAAMVLLRRCRVNAALTIQLFSHLFHYINAVAFNKLVAEAMSGRCSARVGAALAGRLALLGQWAERQGLELAADCHLARVHQAARLIQGEYRSADEVRAAVAACFKLNSVQVRALLSPLVSAELVEAGVQHARTLADELYRADNREIQLEESEWLGVGLLIPGDGFSAEVVRGVPPGLADFLAPLQRAGLCRLAHQPHALGVWTVYMTGYGAQHQTRRPQEPRVQLIQLNKNSNGMGLSIVAAKGAGQSRLGIYIKSVVAGGAAAADGRLAAGDQLLSVDGHSLVGITQEKAAEYLVRTGPTVTLEVAKQGAVLHGLATLLHQPAYNNNKPEEMLYEDRARRNSGTYINPHPALLRPVPPRLELATTGKQRCYHNQDSSDSSSGESEEVPPHYHGSIPRLTITLDKENNQFCEEHSPDTPGCPIELRVPPRPIPVFTFTCEDFDECQNKKAEDEEKKKNDECFSCNFVDPPYVPEPPRNDQSSDSGETISNLPPKMEPIIPKLNLNLYDDCGYGHMMIVEECASACECCRTPQPESPDIPFIDDADSDPIIFENACYNDDIATKVRRILPSVSVDKPETADAECQTPSSPPKEKCIGSNFENVSNAGLTRSQERIRLNKQVEDDTDKVISNRFNPNWIKAKDFDNVECRLRRTIFNMARSISNKSEDTEPSTFSTSESMTSSDCIFAEKAVHKDIGAKDILDSVDRKSWKSPDEYRPVCGKVKALAKHFNDIKLTYCMKVYKRNCQSSPNLSARDEKPVTTTKLSNSTSLFDLHANTKSSSASIKDNKLSEEEVKSIVIQLEDWSKYGSRGSEDTLAQGNEFELPNLPSEDKIPVEDGQPLSMVFSEIVDKKPKTITLDSIKLKSNQSSVNSDSLKYNGDCLEKSSSLSVLNEIMRKERNASKDNLKVDNATESRRESYSNVMQSCPNLIKSSSGRTRCVGGNANLSCPELGAARTEEERSGCARRASERDLPSRLAAEPVKPSKSTPALHQVTSPLPHHHQTLNRSGQMNGAAVGAGAGVGAAPGGTGWPHKSRSSHNLSSVPQSQPQPQHQSQTLPQHAHQDTFYQNLSSMHNINDRWSVARSSGGASGGGGGVARPQSTLLSPHPLSPTPSDHHSEFNSSMSVRAAKLSEMSEEVTRRQLHQQEMQQQMLQQQMMQQPPSQHLLQTQQQMMQTQQQQMMQAQQQQHMQTQQPMMQTQQQQMMQTQQQQQMMQTQQQHMMHMMSQQQMPQQRYEWSQPGPPSPQRAQPPVAPKPQSVRRSDVEADAGPHHQQQHQSSTVQPDDEWYVASALEPPAMSVYGVRGATGASVGAGPGATAAPPNPWAREEREREQEARHNVHRARRDASIAALVALGAQRTPTQSQQLRALQLERDFERRAAQLSQEEGPTTPVGGGGEFPRAAPLSPGAPMPTPAPAQALAPSSQDTPPPLPPQPKSILKTNRQELTNGVHHEQSAEGGGNGSVAGVGAGAGAGGVSRVASGLGALSLSEAPPPPPERGSSFAVMSAVRAQVGGNGAMSPSGSAREGPAGSVAGSGGSGGGGPGTGTPPRDKRVSFHEQPPPPPDTLPPPLDVDDPPSAPHTPHQDPDRFIEEAESMLNTPTTPTTPTAITHTPGVIGAQEVYRDPRARQLAEKQKAQSSGPAVPEAFSFKEKMKMFALESGESHTPKDKVKISRAQRDIDAVR